MVIELIVGIPRIKLMDGPSPQDTHRREQKHTCTVAQWLTAGLAFIGAFSMPSTPPSIAQASAWLFKAVTSSDRWFYYPPHFAEMKGMKV